MVAISHDIRPRQLDEFLDWHTNEHMPERLHLPGFVRGWRYLKEDGDDPKCFTMYELDGLWAAKSPEYLWCLNNPTEWTRRLMSAFVDFSRFVATIDSRDGSGIGGALGTLRIPRTDAVGASQAEALRRTVLSVRFSAGVLSVRAGSVDSGASEAPTVEHRLRGAGTRPGVGALALLEATSIGVADEALTHLRSQMPHDLVSGGARSCAYSLSYFLDCDDLERE